MKFRITRASNHYDYENPPCEGAVLENGDELDRGNMAAQWYLQIDSLEGLLSLVDENGLIITLNSSMLDTIPAEEPTLTIYDSPVE